eukprot:349732-Chlamydomonas_euryale.AAC.2
MMLLIRSCIRDHSIGSHKRFGCSLANKQVLIYTTTNPLELHQLPNNIWSMKFRVHNQMACQHGDELRVRFLLHVLFSVPNCVVQHSPPMLHANLVQAAHHIIASLNDGLQLLGYIHKRCALALCIHGDASKLGCISGGVVVKAINKLVELATPPLADREHVGGTHKIEVQNGQVGCVYIDND